MRLINMSVEFVDENDPSRNGWVIGKIVIFDSIIPEGGGTGTFQKKNFSQTNLKHRWVGSVFNADSEYDISFESNRSFLTKNCLKKPQNAQKLYPETKLPRYVSNDYSGLVWNSEWKLDFFNFGIFCSLSLFLSIKRYLWYFIFMVI